MTISTTHLYDLLMQKVGKETAHNLVQFVEEKVSLEVQQKTAVLATKDDIINLQKWMIGIFITNTIMILGLYAAIFLKH